MFARLRIREFSVDVVSDILIGQQPRKWALALILIFFVVLVVAGKHVELLASVFFEFVLLLETGNMFDGGGLSVVGPFKHKIRLFGLLRNYGDCIVVVEFFGNRARGQRMILFDISAHAVYVKRRVGFILHLNNRVIRSQR